MKNQKKKCLIVYFSQWNTTASIAEQIALGLQMKNYNIQQHNLKDTELPPDASEFDLIGIGTPVYYYRTPFNVGRYLNNLPDLSGKPVFVFLLHGSYPEDTFSSIWKILKSKNADFAGYYHAPGKDIYYEYLKEGYLFSPDQPLESHREKAKLFGKQTADRVCKKFYETPPVQKKATFMHRLERFLASEFFTKHLLSRLFSVNFNKCDSCGKCVQICPTNNITLTANKGKSPAFGRNCLLCLSCELKCHTEAITSPASWFVFRPLILHNLHEASKDSEIKLDRVRLEKGRIKYKN